MNSLGRDLESFDSDDLDQVQEMGLTSMMILGQNAGATEQEKQLLSENERLKSQQERLRKLLDLAKTDSEAKIKQKDEEIAGLKTQLQVHKGLSLFVSGPTCLFHGWNID